MDTPLPKAVKTKAHRAEEEAIAEGTWLQWRANHIADMYCTLGQQKQKIEQEKQASQSRVTL